MSYQEWQYQTSRGISATLALGPGRALILADLPDSFMTIIILAGSTDGLTRDLLEELADSFDLSKLYSDSAAGISLHSITLIFHFRICRRPFIMRQISRLSVIAVSTALLITLSSCSSTQSTLEADDQPSTPTENRETVTSGQISDVPENNNASGESPQGSVTDAANFEIAENEDGTVTISRYIGTETDIVIPHRSAEKLFPRLETSRARRERLKAARA
ncbi:MAG: hypothetical protein ACLRSD_12595 [Oscillibacter sp.]